MTLLRWVLGVVSVTPSDVRCWPRGARSGAALVGNRSTSSVEGPPGPASVLHPDGSTADDVVQGVAVEVAGDAVVVAHCAQPSPGPSDAAACRSAPTPAASARHRTARLVLTGEQVDAATAHRWGLVDALNAVEDP